MKVNLKRSKDTQLAVILDVQGQDGIFILYDNVNGTYKQVYEKRGPVSEVKVSGNTHLVITVRLGHGTGYIIEQYYVIRFTSKGWKEVWSNYAWYMKVLPEIEPGTEIIGTICLGLDQLIYITFTQSNITDVCFQPIDTNYSVKYFKYDYTSESFI
ncbi:hypothetical protein [Acetivibrio cellulolyticus]|uniref:hypothetical protein n=1 Tax=Acetivibrio cellulolyticus TaxID=35830 RepID=UPI0001E2D881|nr:hypothetical protein [Acetivibrio cellulolyticus]